MLIRINKNIESAIYTWLLIALVYSMLLFGYVSPVLTMLIFITWIIFSNKSFDMSSTKTRLVILFTALYIIFIIGLIYTADIKESFSTFEAKSAIFFFPLIFGTTTLLHRSLLDKITIHFLIATTIANIAGLIYGAVNYFQIQDINLLTGKNILFFPGFRPFLMGLFCLTAIIVSFNKLKEKPIRMRSLLYAAIIILSITVLLLSTRTIILCWLGIIIYYTIVLSESSRQKLTMLTISVIVLFISFLSIPLAKDQWNELFDTTPGSNIVLDQDSSLGKDWGGKALRIAIWKCSADILKDHWLLGVGTGDVQDSLQQAYEDRKFYFASRYNRYNAHNEYIQISLATGLPGLIILLSCILYPIWNYKRKFTSSVYLLFLLLFSFICFSESLLEANKGVIWYSFFNSIFAFGYLKSDLT